MLAKEMMQLVPSLLSSEVGEGAQPRLASVNGMSQSGQPALVYAVARREASGCVHLILSNNLNEPVQASVTFARDTEGIFTEEEMVTHGLVPFEKALPTAAYMRKVSVVNGTLREWMGSWSTQVFRFNGTSACATPPAVGAVAGAAQHTNLVSNSGFEDSFSYTAAPSGWSCDVSRDLDRACFATAEVAHSGRKAGRFTTGKDFGSLRIPVPARGASGHCAFEAWIRADREGQVVSVYSLVSAPSLPSFRPPLASEKLLGSVVTSTQWVRLAVPNVTMTEGMALSIGVSKAGIIWLDDVSMRVLGRDQFEKPLVALLSV